MTQEYSNRSSKTVLKAFSVVFTIVLLLLSFAPCVSATVPQNHIAFDYPTDDGVLEDMQSELNLYSPWDDYAVYVYPAYGQTYNKSVDQWTDYSGYFSVNTPRYYTFLNGDYSEDSYGDITGGGSSITSVSSIISYSDLNGNPSTSTATNTSYEPYQVGEYSVEGELKHRFIDYKYKTNMVSPSAPEGYRLVLTGSFYLKRDYTSDAITLQGMQLSFDQNEINAYGANYYVSVSGTFHRRLGTNELLEEVVSGFTNINLPVNGSKFSLSETLYSTYPYDEGVFNGSIVITLSGNRGAYPIVRNNIDTVPIATIYENGTNSSQGIDFVNAGRKMTLIQSFYRNNYVVPTQPSGTLDVFSNGTYDVTRYSKVNVNVFNADGDFSLWDGIMKGVTSFFDFQIGGSQWTIGSVFVIILSVAIVIAVLKIFAG